MNTQSKQKIYISLPISGRARQEVEQHAERVRRFLESRGLETVNPLDIDAGENPEYFDFISADLRALADCDMIFMCRGWSRSRGCRLEHAFACIYGKQIRYE